jgi:ABC-type phosphonate transport system ATPase subunit
VPVEGFRAKDFYHLIEKNRKRLMITDWGVSQCSLEDVFSRICEPPK